MARLSALTSALKSFRSCRCLASLASIFSLSLVSVASILSLSLVSVATRSVLTASIFSLSLVSVASILSLSLVSVASIFSLSLVSAAVIFSSSLISVVMMALLSLVSMSLASPLRDWKPATPTVITPLSGHPEWQRALWAKLQPYAWESGLAAQFLSGDDVLSLLDYTSYFDLTEQPLPDNRQGIFGKLVADQLIQEDVGHHWSITNLGAILFAKDLTSFTTSMARKAARFVAYDGLSRADTVTRRRDQQKGYANGFQELMNYIDALVPSNELIEQAFRKERPLYPSVALRELIANALIHQDMTITGAGPSIEMFSDRLEITNPGKPLVNPE